MEAIWETISGFFTQTGFALFFVDDNWKCLIMIAVACILLYLAIVKKFEPMLLLPIAFGMLLSNLPGADLYHPELFAGGHVAWSGFSDTASLIDYLYLGVKLGIYPCLIFLGVGAMTGGSVGQVAGSMNARYNITGYWDTYYDSETGEEIGLETRANDVDDGDGV